MKVFEQFSVSTKNGALFVMLTLELEGWNLTLPKSEMYIYLLSALWVHKIVDREQLFLVFPGWRPGMLSHLLKGRFSDESS